MSGAGICILAGFVVFALLMVKNWLPALLAMPLMAAWIALVTGMSFTVYANSILYGGAVKLIGPIVLVTFGAMFARVIQKTGISKMIVKKSAEMSADSPRAMALVMSLATAFVFLGMSGLGAIIMVGSITLPIMMSAGIAPVDAAVLMLLGMSLGAAANIAAYGGLIGIFGAEAIFRYYLPYILISAGALLLYIVAHVPAGAGGSGLWGALESVLKGILRLPLSLIQVVAGWVKPAPHTLLKKRQEIPAISLAAPIMPLVVIGVLQVTVGLGAANKDMVDPVAAAIVGFVVAAVYAACCTKPAKLVNLLAGAFVEGIQDVAGVLFLFMGIGMLASAAAHPLAAEALAPIFQACIPRSPLAKLAFFAVLAPAALYRGPLNMYGMGAGIAVVLTSLGLASPVLLFGVFLAVGSVQGISDPTNSHNTWIAAACGVDTTQVLKRSLPFSWGICIALVAYMAVAV